MLVTGIVIGLVAVGSASAITSSSGSPSSTSAGTAHHLAISAAAFAPDSLQGATNDYYNAWDPAELSNQDGGRCFNSDVYLPNNAVITRVRIYYSSNTDGLYFELTRKNLPSDSYGVLASFSDAPSTSGSYGTASMAITSKNVVDTSKYAYAIGVCPFGDATFSGAVITYTT
jgi:hypothetical protein